MSINYAILGILSCKSLTGYDLKKIIQESDFMYWSGNNNQIYKSLVELLDDGLVTNEVHHQESSPSKKIYTITEEGLAELKEWVLSSPEPPEFKKMFLIQLAWADQLSADELNTLLSSYENEVRMQLLMQQEKKRRQTFSADRTFREVHLWDLIHDNLISSYENELSWIQKARKEVCSNIKEANRMKYKLIERNNKKYIECNSAETLLRSEQDALDLIIACSENNTHLLMLHSEVLSDDFFKLRTGLAGQVLQKFINYQVKVAVVLTSEQKIKGKFKELIAESNRGNDFRVFINIPEAENWLLN
jgi:PadR family transcriptional regulator, regulatory protein AphA